MACTYTIEGKTYDKDGFMEYLLNMKPSEASKYMPGVTAVPDFPFKTNYHEVVLKRIIRMAAEQGFEKIGWITGAQTADRYDLSKQVDLVEYHKNGTLIASQFGQEKINETNVKESDLEKYVGKEIAQRLIDSDERVVDVDGKEVKVRAVEGEDLKVGGEWATHLYDKMIPQYLKKFGKKFGAEVGETKIPSDKYKGYINYESGTSGIGNPAVFGINKNNEKVLVEQFGKEDKQKAEDMADRLNANRDIGVGVHSFTITPELKRMALYEGMPLFAMAGKKAIGAPTGALAKAQEMLAEGKSEKEVWKETGWLKGAENKWKWEIDDSGAKFNSQKLKAIDKGKGLLTTDTLNQLLSHDELYKNYPQLRDILTTIEVDFDVNSDKGSFTPATDRSAEGLVDLEAEIKIKAKSIQNVKPTLLHEISHAIQAIQGFAKGGSPEAIKAKLSKTASIDADKVRALAQHLRKVKESDAFKVIEEEYFKANFTDEALKKRNNTPLMKDWFATWDSLEAIAKNYNISPNYLRQIAMDKGTLISNDMIESISEYEQYKSLAGEIEARSVAERAKLTAEQRRETMPYEAQGIPREDWIVTDGKGTSFSVTQKEQPKFATKPKVDYKELLKRYQEAPVTVADEEVIKSYKEKHIAFEPKKIQLTKETFKDFAAKVYTKFVFAEYPAIRLALKGKDPKATQRVQDQINRVWGKGGIVEVFVAGKGPHRLDIEGKPVYIEGSQSLKDIVKGLNPQEYEDYETLRIAERDVALARFRPDIKATDIETSTQVINAMERKYGEGIKKLRDASEAHRKYDDTLLKLLVEEGWLSKNNYETIKSKPESEYYASFMREMDSVGEQVLGGKDPLKRIKGSELRKIPTIESSISNTYKTIKLLETIKLNKSVVDLKDLTPDLAEVIKEIKPHYITKDMPGRPGPRGGTKVSIRSPIQPKNTIIVPVNGVKHFWEVPPDVHKAIDYYSPQEMSMVIKILSGPAKLLRAGATLTAEFIMRNPVRDQFSAMVYSNYGYVPFIDFGKGLFELMKKGDLYQEFKAGGGEQSYFTSMDRTTLNMTSKDILGFRKGLKTYNPIEYLRIASEAMEKVTRLGVYKKAKAKGATVPEATAAARESTLDFRRIGEERRINQIIAFWNANVQGIDIMRRKIKKHPGRTLLRLTMGITIPSIALWLFNNSDDDRKERYNALPGWRKNFFWNIIIKDMPVISFPKPFELGLIFGSLPERILDYIALNDPKEIKTIVQSIKDGAMPGLIPTAALPIIENMTNWSFFMERPIESETIKRLPPGQRANQYTNSVLKKIGKVTNISPIKMENWVRGWSGGLGKLGLDIVDPLFKTDVPEVSKKWYEVTPGIKGFIAKEPIGGAGKDITNFYDNLEEITQAEQGYKVLIKTDTKEAREFDERTNRIRIFAKTFRKESLKLGELRKRKAIIMASKIYTSEQKRVMVDNIDARMTRIARLRNEILLKYKQRSDQ